MFCVVMLYWWLCRFFSNTLEPIIVNRVVSVGDAVDAFKVVGLAELLMLLSCCLVLLVWLRLLSCGLMLLAWLCCRCG